MTGRIAATVFDVVGEGGLGFWIHVTPRARHETVGGLHGDALRVSVKAPPVGGRANAACVRVIAQAFGVRPADVEIHPGAKSRRKRVRVSGEAETLRETFEKLARSA